MSYEKQTWQTGDVVTSAKLNHMEDGIAAGGVLVVNVTYDAETEVSTCDKTAGEMWAACLSGGVVLLQTDGVVTYYDTIASASEQSDGYRFSDAALNLLLSAATANDYPATSGGGPK